MCRRVVKLMSCKSIKIADNTPSSFMLNIMTSSFPALSSVSIISVFNTVKNWSLFLDSAPGRTTTSVRIELLDTGKFRLDGAKPVSDQLLSSPCVLDLLRQHIAGGGIGLRFVLLDEARRETPLLLRRPLYRCSYPLTLKHLCRRRINASLGGRSVERLPLPPSLKQHIQQYPYDLWPLKRRCIGLRLRSGIDSIFRN